ncbi:hypothetical protein KFU94_37775 [Chloroflexi bacterium TSY]|nr:hypothetical protein [Chloroflexi bacterium TSY]
MEHKADLLVHATHEAGLKIGGIGAVLDGLLSTNVYTTNVQRTILAGPYHASDSTYMERLFHPRNSLNRLYDSLHAVTDGVSEEIQSAFQQIEQIFEIAILYGIRRFGNHEHEVLLVDATNPNQTQIDQFKHHLWQHYGIDSSRYEWNPEFNLYLAIAPPLFAALRTLLSSDEALYEQKLIMAHEWLGLPLVFAAQMTEPNQWQSIFYAHETATVRWLIEEHGGHDTRFYNVLDRAKATGLDLETVFGNQDDFFKHAMLKRAIRCDKILAVGDLIEDELRFLDGNFAQASIELVYNGIPHADPTLAEKMESKRRLQTYCENLLGFIPDYVFTHVTRLVLSKALWRDLRVLESLDSLFQQEGKRAVLFVLSTSVATGRRSEWVAAWEAQYGWPIGHRADNGDLIGLEVPFFFDGVEPFNQQASNIQVVFVNQFGWSRERCGQRMPEEMEFADIRCGSDVEFGQSIYEPFGIAQVEPLSYGVLCCVSSVCGCLGFVQRAAQQITTQCGDQMSVPISEQVAPRVDEQMEPNVIIADYVRLPDGYICHSANDALWIDQRVRDWSERTNAAIAAQKIFHSLPRTDADRQTLLRRGQALAKKMSWEVVVAEYLLPALENV